ncbi:hypothetical protein GGR57DRAFT_99633 [Xylariaceae sp. FL1272]|nr:hypothetical protein GGR57DRAFT_99633 [Xylariaceae sp. FL1272]
MNSRTKRPRLENDDSKPNKRTTANSSKPQLTRACAECKKHKIKCFVTPGSSACNKCLKSGIECVPFNFAKKFIDDDSAWKAQAQATIDQLRAAVDQLLQHSNLPGLTQYDGKLSSLHADSDAANASPSDAPGSANFTSEGASVDQKQDDFDLVPLAMNNIYSLADSSSSRLIRLDPAPGLNGPDFISRGVVQLAEAEFLFDHFRDRINPILWDGILCSHQSLNEARQSSSLLVATVLTVAALHIPSREKALHATYDAFISLMRASCMLHTRNLDDIRALCIGSFYLTSLSWSLCSRAVRVAGEVNLHKSSLQFSRGSLESYERVRLWYALYVCDHQFALAYGRPPMMQEDSAIRNVDKLLTSGLCTNGDRILVAQVKLFRILAGAYFMYGCDPDLELGGQDYEMLQSFSISVDQWRFEQVPKRNDMSSAPERPMSSKETALYYHLARFQLNSMSLRGISARTENNNPRSYMNWDRQEAANNAITAATSTVRLIVEDSDLRKSLKCQPIFAHAMIAVCASFLLKMAVVFGEPSTRSDPVLYLPRDLAKYGLNFHTKNALTNVESLIGMLSLVAENTSQRHVIQQVVTGLKELLQRFCTSGNDDTFVYQRSNIPDNGSSMMPYATSRSGNIGGTAETLAPAASSGLIEAQPNLTAAHSADPTQFIPQKDPFDLMGDLDWRFNDGFLWGIDAEMPPI